MQQIQNQLLARWKCCHTLLLFTVAVLIVLNYAIAIDTIANKCLINTMLQTLGIPIPASFLLLSYSYDKRSYIEQLNFYIFQKYYEK